MANKGPTKGGRILVSLPFGENRAPTKDRKGVSTLVHVKQSVASLLGFKPVTKIPQKNVTIKTAAGQRTAKRVQGLGSFRGRSIKLLFPKPRTIRGTSGTRDSVSLPLGSGCTVSQAIEWLQQNKSDIVAGVITPEGKRHQWGEIQPKRTRN